MKIRISKKVVTLVLTVAIIFFAIPGPVLAQKVRRTALPVIPAVHAQAISTSGPVSTPQIKPATDEEEALVSCDYAKPAEAVYSAKFLAVRKKGVVAQKEVFETKIFVQNTGNVPWFAVASGCNESVVSLGTERGRDRFSPFYTSSLFWDSNWLAPNRIKMKSKRVDPQEVAIFTFWSQAPEKNGLYREYFAPVVEHVSWMPEAVAAMDITVGESGIDPETRGLLAYIQRSANLSEINLTGEKRIEVDLSEQKMLLKIGDEVIKEFRVSTGKASTPTPVGTTTIIEKREVRVAGSAPHYIMPKWMMFRKGGYGIHALPSLANDRGVFWREALSHIGSPRSHGCIRLLPKDAEFAYNFTDVGTQVVVYR